MRLPTRTLLLLCLPVACAPIEQRAADSSDEMVSAAPGGAAPVEASADSEPAAPQRSASRTRLSDDELAIWKDPKFKRRFAESYLAETEIEPTVTEDERDTMLEILELISSDQLDEAARMLVKNRGESVSAVFDFTLANVRFQQERWDEAAAAYEAAVEKYPKFRRAWGNLGQIRFRQERFADAVQAFTRVLELGGGDAITYGLLGVSHSRTGEYVSAESAFRLASMLAPTTLDWKMGLAESFFRQQRYADAIALFDSLIEQYPDRADLWLAQGEAYARVGQPLKAAENFELVDRLGGSTVASLENLGDIYANEELYDLAVDSYLRALDHDPEADPARAIRAAKYLSANGALDETNRLVNGIESARGERLEVDERKDLLKLRARLAVAAGAGDEEARVLEEIVALDPLDGDALILLGQHAARTGDPEKAVFYFERAAGIEGFEADAKVRHAQLLVQQGRYDEALPLLRRAQTVDPRDNIQKYLEQVERVAQTR